MSSTLNRDAIRMAELASAASHKYSQANRFEKVLQMTPLMKETVGLEATDPTAGLFDLVNHRASGDSIFTPELTHAFTLDQLNVLLFGNTEASGGLGYPITLELLTSVASLCSKTDIYATDFLNSSVFTTTSLWCLNVSAVANAKSLMAQRNTLGMANCLAAKYAEAKDMAKSAPQCASAGISPPVALSDEQEGFESTIVVSDVGTGLGWMKMMQDYPEVLLQSREGNAVLEDIYRTNGT